MFEISLRCAHRNDRKRMINVRYERIRYYFGSGAAGRHAPFILSNSAGAENEKNGRFVEMTTAG